MTTQIKTITCKELAVLCTKTELDVIDVRTPVEFRELHCKYARNTPLDSLDPHSIMAARVTSKDEPVYVICRSGQRAEKACEAFLKAGFTNVINVEGGTSAWDTAGLPVVRGKKAVSLERQVRIAAGFIVLAGALLTQFVDPLWFVVPAFVGAGLMFAGITDTCAMGMMISKMPWNKI